MKSNTLVVFTAFLLGYAISDLANNASNGFIEKASADVDGMDYRELRRDRDFKKAVRHVVDRDCSVILLGGYVDGEYVYGMTGDVSC